MTRINAGIPPRDLSDKHLLAEHREIKRIPNAITSGKAKLENLPTKFTLGTGHVRFFYDKQGYLHDRYCALYVECKRRGFKVTSFYTAWKGIPNQLWGDWTPTKAAIALIKQRIKERS
jgi:deoxyribonuclease (pyrimidine dimer)